MEVVSTMIDSRISMTVWVIVSEEGKIHTMSGGSPCVFRDEKTAWDMIEFVGLSGDVPARANLIVA